MKPLKLGRTSVSTTARGTVIRSLFAIIDASEIITSHDALTLEPCAKYPQKLQPRDRSRLTSEQQIEGISRNLRPELLGDALTCTDGSPILGPDLITESGNARAMSILRAYAHGGIPAKRYRQFVMANLKEFGLVGVRVPTFPVLVRIRQTKINRYQFVVEANETAVASMSDAEQARIDANRMTPALLSLALPNKSVLRVTSWADSRLFGQVGF